MAKKLKGAIGIDISTDGIRVVMVENKNGLLIRQRQAVEFGPGTFSDEQGVNWEEIEKSLVTVLAKANIRGGRAHVAIPGQFAVIRELSLPDFTDDELRSLIEFELTHSIHVPFPEVVFDFVRVPMKEEGAEKKASVILVAADKQMCERFVTLLQKFRIRVKSIELRSLAANRVLKRVKDLPQTFLLVETDVRGTNVHVFHGDVLYLTRQVPMRLIETGAFEVVNGESTVASREGMNDLVSMALGNGDELSLSALEQLPPNAYVTRIGAELTRTMNFFHYTLNRRDAEFGEIIFVGGCNLTHAVLNDLEQRLGLRVTSLSFQDMIGAGLLKERSGMSLADDDVVTDYGVAIGLALREV